MIKCTKVLIENFSEPCLLFLLLQKPSYGYELKQDLEKNFSCQADIGNLYRCLAKLQKNGFIAKSAGSQSADENKPAGGPKRSMYKLTDKGQKFLANWMNTLKETKNTINRLLANYKNYENDQQ